MSLIFSDGKLNRLSLSTRTLTLTTKTVNNWDLSGSSIVLCDLSTIAITTYLSVTGILAGIDGEIKIIIPTHASKFINFYHNNTGSDAANRLFLPGSSNYQCSPRNGVILIYLSSTGSWQIIGETGLSGIGVGASSIGSVGSGGT